MSKQKYCETGEHYVDKLWRAKTRTTPSACQRCDKGKPKRKEDKSSDLDDAAEMDAFFKANYNRIPVNCMNCGQPLQAFTDKLKKCVSAHILPKAIFESVKTDSRNLFFLGLICNCHKLWDDRDAAKRKTMPCYEIALEKVQEFYNELTPHEQNQADKYLGINQI